MILTVIDVSLLVKLSKSAGFTVKVELAKPKLSDSALSFVIYPIWSWESNEKLMGTSFTGEPLASVTCATILSKYWILIFN